MNAKNSGEKLHFATINVSAQAPLPASRHGGIQRLADDVFFVRGRMRSTPKRSIFARLFVYFSRTMTIVRHRNERGEYELALFNTLRMSEAGLAQVEKLGKITNIVRLGSFHGVDDAYYVQRYDAQYWIVDGMRSADGLESVPRSLGETSPDDAAAPEHKAGPILGAQAFIFKDIRYPEAIYILPPNAARPGVAISTDSIQNHRSIWDWDNSFFVSLSIWRIGLLGKARLGPIWLREQAPRRAQTPNPQDKHTHIARFFRPQFARLLRDYDFDMLIPGHGWPIRKAAKTAIQNSMDVQLALMG